MAGSNAIAGARVFDHVGIAVWSIEDALPFFRDALGGRFANGGDDERLGIRTLQLGYAPGVRIELLQPLSPDSFLHRYLEGRGPGLHHLTLLVDDVQAAIADLAARGFEPRGTRLDSPAWRETFVRPIDGTVIQLFDSTVDWDRPFSGITTEDVLAGRVVWRSDVPVLREDGPAAPQS